jgi:hypothetical protein
MPAAPDLDIGRLEGRTRSLGAAEFLAHVPAKWNAVRHGEPLFADKDMRQHKNLRRFPLIWDHSVIPYQRKTL